MTKKKTVTVTDATTEDFDIVASNLDDTKWTRERCLEFAVQVFNNPYFSKEANTYAILDLADNFTKFVIQGKNAVFPAPATPVAA
jgi:hypothetical protein